MKTLQALYPKPARPMPRQSKAARRSRARRRSTSGRRRRAVRRPRSRSSRSAGYRGGPPSKQQKGCVTPSDYEATAGVIATKINENSEESNLFTAFFDRPGHVYAHPFLSFIICHHPKNDVSDVTCNLQNANQIREQIAQAKTKAPMQNFFSAYIVEP